MEFEWRDPVSGFFVSVPDTGLDGEFAYSEEEAETIRAELSSESKYPHAVMVHKTQIWDEYFEGNFHRKVWF